MGSIPAQPEESPPSGDLEQERLRLDSTSFDGRPQFRAFAEFIFGYLQEVGFPEMDKLRAAPRKIPVEPLEGAAEPGDMSLSKVFLNNEQEVFLLFGTERSSRGHEGIAALNWEQAQTWLTGSLAETAIIAATTVMQRRYKLEPIDIAKLRRALSLIEGPLTKSAEEHARDTSRKMVSGVDKEYLCGRLDYESWSEVKESALRFQGDLQISTLEYVLALLRYRKSDFDSYPRREQHESIWRTCERVNKLWDAAEGLSKFLEYGTTAGLPNKVAERNKDVQAAVLKDVVGLTHREIGEDLGIPRPPKAEIKGSHDTVGKMIKRGRELLQDALGEEDWRARAAALKADMERYNALPKGDQTQERLAEFWGVSTDEARERYIRETNQYAKTLAAAMGITEQEALNILNQPD